MRVLFTSLFPLWQIHFVTELNLMERHASAADEIFVLTCDAQLNSCECNPEHDLPHCLRCMGIRQSGLGLLSQKICQLPVIHPRYGKKYENALRRTFVSTEDLMEYRVDGFDIGSAVFSSLVDHTKSTQPDMRINAKEVSELLLDAHRTYQTALAYIQKYHFDQVYLFNGRYAVARPWLRACQKSGVKCLTHERSLNPTRCFLFENDFPHNFALYSDRVKKFWEERGDDPAIVREGHHFFEERPKGEFTGWVSFIKAQEENKLPESWDASCRNICIFTTTDSEYAGLRNVSSFGMYPSQAAACAELVRRILALDHNIQFYLRIHPNSKTEQIRWWEQGDFCNFPNLHVIPPESEVSSYALLFNSEKSVAYMSSLGLEATYWGKPSILLVPSFYSGVDAVYEPTSCEEAAQLVLADLSPKPVLNAIKVGAFLRCGGIQLPYSTAVNYYTLTFKGCLPEPSQKVQAICGECEKSKAFSETWSTWRKRLWGYLKVKKAKRYGEIPVK